MITIKNNCYNEKEKDALAFIFLKAKNALTFGYCEKHNDTCETCDYRHVCYDIEKAYSYALKEMCKNESH